MKTKFFTLTVLMMSAVAGNAQTVVIDSLDGAGTLTATVPSNSVYTIEWKGALDAPGDWNTAWYQHRHASSSNGSIQVEVPMAFRLTCWTNGTFIQTPVGRTYHYSVTNQAASNNSWNKDVHIMGDAYMPHQTNSYRTVWSEEWYSHPALIPEGAQARSSIFTRADENGVYALDSEYLRGPMQEDLIWQNGPTGTVWQYEASAPHTVITSTIVAVEDVVIGSTTYEDCIKIESIGAYELWLDAYPDRRYYEWIQPGGYLVKTENYWVHQDFTNVTPVIYELQGWTDQ